MNYPYIRSLTTSLPAIVISEAADVVVCVFVVNKRSPQGDHVFPRCRFAAQENRKFPATVAAGTLGVCIGGGMCLELLP